MRRSQITAIVWIALIVAMATGDWWFGGRGEGEAQTAAWLVLFTVGVLATLLLLVEPMKKAFASVLVVLGSFAGLYSLDWMVAECLLGRCSQFVPGGSISLYPFFVYVPWWAFITMTALGLVMLVTGLSGLGLVKD